MEFPPPKKKPDVERKVDYTMHGRDEEGSRREIQENGENEEEEESKKIKRKSKSKIEGKRERKRKKKGNAGGWVGRQAGRQASKQAKQSRQAGKQAGNRWICCPAKVQRKRTKTENLERAEKKKEKNKILTAKKLNEKDEKESETRALVVLWREMKKPKKSLHDCEGCRAQVAGRRSQVAETSDSLNCDHFPSRVCCQSPPLPHVFLILRGGSVLHRAGLCAKIRDLGSNVGRLVGRSVVPCRVVSCRVLLTTALLRA